MKEEHKNLIEFLILEFKKDFNGLLLKDEFCKLIKNEQTRDLIANFIINELSFVEVKDYKYLRLTNDGWNFTSFKNIECVELAQKEKEQIELENLKTSTQVNKFLIKTKWLPLFLSAISILVSLIFGYLTFKSTNEMEDEGKTQLKVLKQKIKLLEKDVKLLKNYTKVKVIKNKNKNE